MTHCLNSRRATCWSGRRQRSGEPIHRHPGGRGREFDEPVYYLQGLYGIKLKQSYTGEQLASAGYRLKQATGVSQAADTGGQS